MSSMGVITVHLLWATVTTSVGCLELYTSRGTHYQVGLDVGQHFQDAVQSYYATMTDLHTKLLPFVETKDGMRIYETYLKMAETYFPQYVDELRGIAIGANLPFKQVFTNHIWDELSTLIGAKQKKSCTDVYVNDVGNDKPRELTRKPQFGLGHNEDGSSRAKTRAYILHCIIVDNVTGTVEENFTSFTYPGELSGDAYGFNMHGVVLTMNAVLPVIVGIGAVPRDFVLRATFAARSQAELETLLLSEGTGVGYGYNLNYANTQDGARTLVSYEVAPLENQPRALVSKFTVGCDGDNTNTTGPYFHFNLYNHTDVAQMTSELTSSYHRQARVAQLPEVRNICDALNVLGDTHDTAYPIYRTSTPPDQYSTLTTAMFDLMQCRLYVYVDNPVTGSGPYMTLTLPAGRQCR